MFKLKVLPASFLLHAKKLSQNVCTQSLNNQNYSRNQFNNHIVLFFPFLGAKKSAIKKYENMYKEVGCEVYTHQTNVTDFLWPSSGFKNSYNYLLKIEEILNKAEYKDKTLVTHSMSVGCYFYSLIVINALRNPLTFEKFLSNTKGQIVESPVVGTLNEMSLGMALAAFPKSKIKQKILVSLANSYFFVTKNHTVKVYEDIIEKFLNEPLSVKSLIYTTKGDPMALPKSFENFVASWKKGGVDVDDRVWENSRHARLMMTHLEEYKKCILNFLLTTSQNKENQSLI